MSFPKALVVDVLCVLVFAIIGRSSHGEVTDLVGTARTAWPFLAACAAGSVVARRRSRPATLAYGTVVWAGTVVLGLVLRSLSGGGVQLSFGIVTAVFLGLTIVGWRVGLVLVRRARARRQRAVRA